MRPKLDGAEWAIEERAIIGYYVQVRYPCANRWATVAVADARRDAACLAAAACHDRLDQHGRGPIGVRILDTDELRGEDGLAEAVRAVADLQQLDASGLGPLPVAR